MTVTIESDLDVIGQALDHLVPALKVPYGELYEAARYSLLSSGKRIRPLLTICTGKMFGASMNALLQPACALELIHTYSLIHDDLPSIDNDDFRRGKPSLHKAFGEDKAILAGDFLLTYSFELLATSPHLSDSQKLKLITTLAKASGGEGMIGGQVMDLRKEKHDLKLVNQMKTGALLCASILFGGIIADVSSSILSQLQQMGKKVGDLFQVCDDILDGEREDDLQEARKEAVLYFQEATTILESLPGKKDSLHFLFEKIFSQISK